MLFSLWKTERPLSLREKMVVPLLHTSDGFAPIKTLKYAKIHRCKNFQGERRIDGKI
jgi:hypothetical protein